MTHLNIQEVGAFKKASNRNAPTKDDLVNRIAKRVATLKIVNSINQENGNLSKTLTIRYGSRPLGIVEQPEGVSEAEFRASVKEAVLQSTSLKEQAWEMYQSFSQTNSLNAQASGGQS